MENIVINNFKLACHLLGQDYCMSISSDENGKPRFNFLNTPLLRQEIKDFEDNETLQSYLRGEKKLKRKLQRFKCNRKNKK